MFSYKSLTVLYLTFRYLIHFKLIFAYIVLGEGPTSFFCIWIPSFFTTICWIVDCPFPPLNDFVIHWKSKLFVRIYFCSKYSVPLVYMSSFMFVPYCFEYYSFITQFEIRKYEASSFDFVFKTILTLWYPLSFYMNFRMVFLLLGEKKLVWNIDSDYIKYVDHFE